MGGVGPEVLSELGERYPLPRPNLGLESFVETVEWLVATHARSDLLERASERGYVASVALKGNRPTSKEIGAILAAGTNGPVEQDKARAFTTKWEALRSSSRSRRTIEDATVAAVLDALGLDDRCAAEVVELARAWQGSGNDPRVRRYEEARVRKAIEATRIELDRASVPSKLDVLVAVSSVLRSRGDAWTAEEAEHFQVPSLRLRSYAARRTQAATRVRVGGWVAKDSTEDDNEARIEPISRNVVRWDPRKPPGHAVVVTADGGTGKSHLLRWHIDSMLRLAESQERASEDITIPLLVRAATLVDAIGATTRPGDPIDVGRALAAAVESDGGPSLAGLGESLAIAAEQGRLHVAIDAWEGLSGASQDSALAFVDAVSSSGNSLLVAVRPGARQLLQDVLDSDHVVAELQSFGDAEVADYVSKFFTDPEQAKRLQELIRSDIGLASMATSPLLLSYLCRIVRDGDTASTKRSALLLATLRALLSSVGEPDDLVDVLGGAAAALGAEWRTGFGAVPREQMEAAVASELGQSFAAGARLVQKFVDSRVLLEERAVEGMLVRFPHQLLHTASVAATLAKRSPEARWSALSPHVWFDPDWDDVFLLSAGMASDPSDLIWRVLKQARDIWLVNLSRAALMLLECERVAVTEVIQPVIVRLMIGVKFPHAEYRRRPIDAFVALIQAGVAEARFAAETLLAESALPDDALVPIAAALLASGYEQGHVSLVDLASGRNGNSTRYRAEAIVALAETRSTWSELVEQILTSRTTPPGLLKAVAPALQSSGVDLEAFVRLLFDRSVLLRDRAELSTLLANTSARSALAAAIGDSRIPWSVRAAGARALLTSQQPANAAACDLVRSPNLVVSRRAQLFAAILVAGPVDDDSVAEAATLLLSSTLEPDVIRDLATALVATPVGRSRIEELLPSLATERPITFISAVRAGSKRCVDHAIEMIHQSATKPEWRCDLLLALSELGRPDLGHLMEVVLGDPHLPTAQRVRLLMRVDGQSAADRLSTLLSDDGLDEDLLHEVVRSLYRRGGNRQVETVLLDRAVSLDRRVEIAIAACFAVRRSPKLTLPLVLDQLLEESRPDDDLFVPLAVSMATAGSTSEIALDVLLSFASYMQGPHRLLQTILASSSTTLSVVEQVLDGLDKPPVVKPKIALADKQMYERLESVVGMTIGRYLTAEDVDEFGAFVDQSDEPGAFEWLENNVPFYGHLVHRKFRDVSAAHQTASGFASAKETTPMDESDFLNWYEATRGKPFDPDSTVRLFRERHPSPDLAAMLLGRSDELDWPTGPAGRLLVERASRFGVRYIEQLIHDPGALRSGVLTTLEAGDAFGLLESSALYSLVVGERNAPPLFYAAIGAAMLDWREEAVAFMRECCSLLPDQGTFAREMVSQGLRTIREVSLLHGMHDRPILPALMAQLRGVQAPETDELAP